jgi:uncharacterized membrane protein (Fun14 family)
MGLIDELLHFITSGSIFGIPSLAVMAIPFVLGLIVGVLAIKFLKIAILIIVILAAVIYFGLYSLNIPTLQQLSNQYGSSVLSYGALLIGMLPLSIGFIIGAIAGIIFG